MFCKPDRPIPSEPDSSGPARNPPHFLGVGPEKTGTTWIHHHLAAHPNVQCPPVKEVRYFYEQHHFPHESVWDRYLKQDASWHRRDYSLYLAHRLRSLGRHPYRCLFTRAGRERLYWDLSYLLRKHDDNWYLSLFRPELNGIAGEISPQYFFLPDTAISHVKSLAPDCKILISLRRPTDWLWSFAKMNLASRFLEKNYGTLEQFIETKKRYCSFSDAVTRWRRHFPAATHVVFYEDLREDPWTFYRDICDFLGIAPDPARKALLPRIVNRGTETPIPEEY